MKRATPFEIALSILEIYHGIFGNITDNKPTAIPPTNNHNNFSVIPSIFFFVSFAGLFSKIVTFSFNLSCPYFTSFTSSFI